MKSKKQKEKKMSDFNTCQFNPQTQSCRNICQGPNRPSWCDGVAAQYCNQCNQNNGSGCSNNWQSYCACFDPDFNKEFPGLGITACFKPSCVNSSCSGADPSCVPAYKTNDMLLLSQNCPSFCGNLITVTDHSKVIKLVANQYIQGCAKSIPVCPGNLTSTQNKVIFLACLLIIVVLLVIIFAGPKNE